MTTKLKHPRNIEYLVEYALKWHSKVLSCERTSVVKYVVEDVERYNGYLNVPQMTELLNEIDFYYNQYK